MRLNLGSGHSRMTGYVNVDRATESSPDVQWDLEQFPWPWPDNSADEILFNHSLEHMGANANVFLKIMTEVYRICKADAVVRINVPHPRHDTFLNDPTHVRPITPSLLQLFSRKQNDGWKAAGGANTPFAHYLNVDFDVLQANRVLDEPYSSQFVAGKITPEELGDMERKYNNVVREFQILLQVRK